VVLAGLIACTPVATTRPISEPKVLAPWPSRLRRVWTEYATDTGVRRVDITGGGATLTLSYRDHQVEVVSNNEHMNALVSVYRQGAEGWLAVGRVDGSTDVADNMITRVVRG